MKSVRTSVVRLARVHVWHRKRAWVVQIDKSRFCFATHSSATSADKGMSAESATLPTSIRQRVTTTRTIETLRKRSTATPLTWSSCRTFTSPTSALVKSRQETGLLIQRSLHQRHDFVRSPERLLLRPNTMLRYEARQSPDPGTKATRRGRDRSRGT